MRHRTSYRYNTMLAILLCSAVSCSKFTGGDPAIELEIDHLDMGAIPSYENSTRQVKVYNRGKGPLSILSVKTGCGCTSGRMLSPYIPAESEGTLEVTIDPKKVTSMASTQTVTLLTNDPVNRSVDLLVSSQVQREVLVLPGSVMGGTISQGAGATAEVTVVQNVDIPLNITGVSVEGDGAAYIEGSYEELPEDQWGVDGRREYTARARVSPAAPPGKLDAMLVLDIEDPRLKRLVLPVRLDVQPVYRIAPRDIALGPLAPGTIVSDAFTMQMRAPVEITEVTTGNEHLSVTWRPGDNPGTIVFDVSVSDDATGPALRDSFVLVLTLQGQEYREEVSALVRLEGAAAP